MNFLDSGPGKQGISGRIRRAVTIFGIGGDLADGSRDFAMYVHGWFWSRPTADLFNS